MKPVSQNNIYFSQNSVHNYTPKKICTNKNTSNCFEFSKAASDAIKNNAASLINFNGNHQTKSIEQIVAQLKKEYQIDARFSNLDVAKLTLDAVEDFVKLNDKDMFKGLVIRDYKSDEDCIWKTKSNWVDNSFVLELNNEHNIEKIQSIAQNEYDNCLIASNQAKYYLYESLGEFLCFKYNPYAYTLNSKDNDFSAIKQKCARKMGTKAMGNFSRFNSTYIASKMSKIETPKQAKELYEERLGADINFPKAQKEPEIKGIEHNFSDVDEAGKYLKEKYNIEAEFDNLTTANYAAAAIEDFIEINENEHIFDGLVIKKEIDKVLTFGGMNSRYSYKNNQILDSSVCFNSAYDWKRYDKLLEKDYNCAQHASKNPKMNFYHELAHWLDFQNDPLDYSRRSDAYKNGIYVNDYGKRIFGKVSGYAQESSLEFKAEYIAAKMCGLTFPKLVDEIFKQNYNAKGNKPLKFPEVSAD